MNANETMIETINFQQLATTTDRQPEDDRSLVVLGSFELSMVTGGEIDQSDFERYGQAIGEDLGGRVGLGHIGREVGRDVGRALWEKRRRPGFMAFIGGIIGAGIGL